MWKYFLIICLLSISLSCTVNEFTGKVEIINKSDKDANNIKIGDQVIAYDLPAGTSQDYWFFSEITGKVTTEGGFDEENAIVDYDDRDIAIIDDKAKFKLGYHGVITLYENNENKYKIIADVGIKQEL